MRQRTQAVNGLRAYLAELGIIGPLAWQMLRRWSESYGTRRTLACPQRRASRSWLLPSEASADQIERLERAIVMEAKHDEDMRRLTTIPGVGAITAATIKALVPDPGGSSRHMGARLIAGNI